MSDQTTDEGHRDVRLGEAVRRFDPPEHAAGFWAAAESRLAEGASAAPVPGRRRRPVMLVTAAAAAAIVLVAALVGLPGGHGIAPAPEQAAARQLLERLTLAMSSAHSLSAAFVQRSRGAGRETWSVVSEGTLLRTAAGDYRIEEHYLDPGEPHGGQHPPMRRITTYDARSRTARDLVWTVDGDVYGHEFVNTQVEMNSLIGFWREATAVQALLDETSPTTPVEAITYEGRPAWKTWLGQSLAQPWFMEIVVDRKTGFLLRERIRYRGATVEWRYNDLVVDGPVPQEAFTIDFPKNARVMTVSDDGLHAVSLSDVDASLGYQPPAPTRLPVGFELTEAVRQVDPSADAGAANGPRDITLWYRRGFDWLSVSVMPLSSGTSMSPDEAERNIRMSSPQLAASLERTTLTGGEFAGATALSGIDPMAASGLGPVGLMIVSDGYLVTMSGDLTRAELLRAADSFAPLPK